MKSMTLKQFRAFRDLHMNGLGRVNLLTGKNNTGKSSVLEGVRILSSNAVPTVIYSILSYRDEHIERLKDEGNPGDPEGFFGIPLLFHGFPKLSESPGPIVISTNGGPRPMEVIMSLGWFSEGRDQEGNYRLIPQKSNPLGDAESIAALVIETKGGKGKKRRKQTLPLDTRSPPYFRRRHPFYPESADRTGMRCNFVSPYGVKGTAELGHLWDRVALTQSERDVIEALRMIDPEISAVSMIDAEGIRGSRTAIVRADNIPRPVPLHSFGDGMNRLFGIILSLVDARGGLLLIDEIENSLHYSILPEAWRIIFHLAETLDIQVFATTHSWGAIEAFQKAAGETPEAGVLIRLSRRRDEDIVPTVFTEDELAIVTRDRIEVR